jgi:hypothetical protein
MKDPPWKSIMTGNNKVGRRCCSCIGLAPGRTLDGVEGFDSKLRRAAAVAGDMLRLDVLSKAV